jgi:hypothetical protein
MNKYKITVTTLGNEERFVCVAPRVEDAIDGVITGKLDRRQKFNTVSSIGIVVNLVEEGINSVVLEDRSRDSQATKPVEEATQPVKKDDDTLDRKELSKGIKKLVKERSVNQEHLRLVKDVIDLACCDTYKELGEFTGMQASSVRSWCVNIREGKFKYLNRKTYKKLFNLFGKDNYA